MKSSFFILCFVCTKYCMKKLSTRFINVAACVYLIILTGRLSRMLTGLVPEFLNTTFYWKGRFPACAATYGLRVFTDGLLSLLLCKLMISPSPYPPNF